VLLVHYSLVRTIYTLEKYKVKNDLSYNSYFFISFYIKYDVAMKWGHAAITASRKKWSAAGFMCHSNEYTCQIDILRAVFSYLRAIFHFFVPKELLYHTFSAYYPCECRA
jgi:hypothetical protein